MAEQFQTGICEGSFWWSSSRNIFGSSPFSSNVNNDSDSSSSLLFPADILLKPDPVSGSTDNSSMIAMDSTLQFLGIGPSSLSATSDWRQSLLRDSRRAEANYKTVLQEDNKLNNSSLNYGQENGVGCRQIQNQWNPKDFSAGNQDSSPVISQGFSSVDYQNPQNPVTSSGDCTSFGYPSTLLQTLFDADPQPQRQQQQQQQQQQTCSLFDDGRIMNYSDNCCSNSSPNHPFLPNKLSSLSKQEEPLSQLQFHNNVNAPFWNNNNNVSSIPAINDVQPCFPPTFLNGMSCPNNFISKVNNEEVHQDSGKKTKSTEHSFKRPRIETPSPLPTFKVRKEKLGDRITALQQLVSPFGKTDTASVLHEAIEYIKFLHDQVNVLSTPYMKNGTPVQQQKNLERQKKDQEAGPNHQDLTSRGLCLVPMSLTFPVAAETTSDFWTPTFGVRGTFS